MENDMVDEVLAHIDNAAPPGPEPPMPQAPQEPQPPQPTPHQGHQTRQAHQENYDDYCDPRLQSSPNKGVWDPEYAKTSGLVAAMIFVASLPQFRQMMHSVPMFSGMGSFGQATMISLIAFALYYGVEYLKYS